MSFPSIEVGNQIFTNRHNLPPEIVAAVLKDRYTDADEDPFDESASTLTSPVRQVILKRREMEKPIEDRMLRIFDVVDQFYSFMGSVAHQVLEDSWHDGMSSIVEQRYYQNVLGKVISGKTDCFDEPEIRDYKNTKVYKIQKGDYHDWECGQNVYAWLLRKCGFKVERLNVWALLSDWKRGELYKKNYPEAPIVQVPLRLWTMKEQEEYVYDRVQKIIDASKMPSNQLPECTKKEMWQDIKDFAIMKKGGKRATKCFTKEEEEEAFEYYNSKYKDDPDFSLQTRYNDRTRCLEYCPCSPICNQHHALLKKEGREDHESAQQPGPLLF